MTISRFCRILFVTGLAVFCLSMPPAFANESAVRIEAPETAAAGQEVEIVLHISHSGNNFLHYTELVELKINGEISKTWEYSNFSKPPGENFTLRFAHPANETLEIEARASCNRHGSRNTDTQSVSVTSE